MGSLGRMHWDAVWEDGGNDGGGPRGVVLYPLNAQGRQAHRREAGGALNIPSFLCFVQVSSLLLIKHPKSKLFSCICNSAAHWNSIIDARHGELGQRLMTDPLL